MGTFTVPAALSNSDTTHRFWNEVLGDALTPGMPIEMVCLDRWSCGGRPAVLDLKRPAVDNLSFGRRLTVASTAAQMYKGYKINSERGDSATHFLKSSNAIKGPLSARGIASASTAMAAQIDPSAQVYSNLFLSLYDWFVLWFVNNYIWCCRTDTVLLPFFQAHIGEGAHLDIGAGTGFFPSHSVQKLNKCKEFALLDLNPNTLVAASAATRRAGYKGEIETVNASIFEPPSTSLRGRFDSISIFYVFHCLSGSFPDKATRVMTSLIPALAPGGVIYGSTVLGYSTGHNWLGVPLMNLLNRRGDFGNADDTFEGLEQAFNGLFEEVDIRQVGKVALFTIYDGIRAEQG